MVAVQVLQVIESNTPGMAVAVIQADDGETYQAPFPVYGAIIQPNRDSQATDSWGVTFTRGTTLVTIRLTGTTSDVDCTLWLFGV